MFNTASMCVAQDVCARLYGSPAGGTCDRLQCIDIVTIQIEHYTVSTSQYAVEVMHVDTIIYCNAIKQCSKSENNTRS